MMGTVISVMDKGIPSGHRKLFHHHKNEKDYDLIASISSQTSSSFEIGESIPLSHAFVNVTYRIASFFTSCSESVAVSGIGPCGVDLLLVTWSSYLSLAMLVGVAMYNRICFGVIISLPPITSAISDLIRAKVSEGDVRMKNV